MTRKRIGDVAGSDEEERLRQEGEIIPPEDELQQEDRVLSLLQSISGSGSTDIVLHLHRAQEKNPAQARAFIREYPSDTPIQQIYRDAQEHFEGGNFVLIARDHARIVGKAPFSVEKDPMYAKPTIQPPAAVEAASVSEAMSRVASAVEKRVLLDKVGEIASGGPARGGESAGLSAILSAMIQQQTRIFEIMMLQKQESPKSNTKEILDVLKMGLDIGQGRDIGDSDDSLTSIIGKALPVLGNIVQNLPRPASRPAGRPSMRPAVPAGTAPAALPAPPPPPPSAVPSDPTVIARTRVIEEIRYCLRQPPSEKLFVHVGDYVDMHLPGVLDQLLGLDEDTFVSQVATFHPEFVKCPDWFRAFYRVMLSVMEQEGAEEEGDGQPAGGLPAKPAGVEPARTTEESDGE